MKHGLSLGDLRQRKERWNQRSLGAEALGKQLVCVDSGHISVANPDKFKRVLDSAGKFSSRNVLDGNPSAGSPGPELTGRFVVQLQRDGDHPESIPRLPGSR